MPRPYVSISTARTAILSFKFTDRGDQQAAHDLAGPLQSETFTVEHARSRVYALRGTGAVAIADTAERKSVVAQSRLVCS